MSQVLSSDILEAQFGPTEIVVLSQNGLNRVICTRTVPGGRVLEISQVNFNPTGIKTFSHVHRAVAAGESMGKAFRQADVKFNRIERSVRRAKTPEFFAKWFGNDRLVTMVEVTILAGEEQILYSTILEVYSPEVRWPTLSSGAQEKRIR